MVGDATHDETSQKLKELRLSLAGMHFSGGEWCTTQIPLVEVACNDESEDAVDLAVQAAKHILLTRHQIVLEDILVECFWDGKPEAIKILKKHFPGIPVRMCIEHAKRNVAKRYHGGFKHLVKNTIEMISFTPPMVFHLSAELLLENLVAAAQDTVYLTSAMQGGAFVAVGGVYTAPYQTSFRESEPGYSTYVPQVLESGWMAADLLHGSTKKATVDKMFSNPQDEMKLASADGNLRTLYTSHQDLICIKVPCSVAMGCMQRKVVLMIKDTDVSLSRN